MEVEKFRGYIATLTAAACVIGGAIGAAWAWHEASVNGITADLAIILAVFTGLIGSGSTYLFLSDAASRASHAAERSFASGSVSGATAPEQVPTTSSDTASASMNVGAEPGGPPPASLDDAEAPPPDA